MDYFLSPDTDTDNRFSLMFRAENASEAPREILDRILRYFELYLDLLDSVDRKVVFNPPTYSVRINQQNYCNSQARNRTSLQMPSSMFYLDEQISLSKAAEYLGISLIEARELVKKWGVES